MLGNKVSVDTYHFSTVGLPLIFTPLPYSQYLRQPVQHHQLHHWWYWVTEGPSVVDIKHQHGQRSGD